MMGVHVIGTAVQDEGDSFAPRVQCKNICFWIGLGLSQNP